MQWAATALAARDAIYLLLPSLGNPLVLNVSWTYGLVSHKQNMVEMVGCHCQVEAIKDCNAHLACTPCCLVFV